MAARLGAFMLLMELKEISVKVSSTLETFRLGCLFMIRVFLKKAVALEGMTIRFNEDDMDGTVLLEHLSKFPMGSKKCRISLQHGR